MGSCGILCLYVFEKKQIEMRASMRKEDRKKVKM